MKPGEIERVKELLPTTLGSEEIRGTFAAEILQRSVFSARMASASYLQRLREVCAQVVEGTINEATARAALEACLASMGHSPTDEGGITNPASIRRLNLIIDTQRAMASNVARLSEQTDAIMYQQPAWQLTRLESRSVPRVDWMRRWRAAGEACGFEGACRDRMVALKTSDIWQHLGEGAGGFTDTLGNPYPPFAFNSGLDWLPVSREQCVKLGLIAPDEKLAPLDDPSLALDEAQLDEASKRYGIDFSDLKEYLA